MQENQQITKEKNNLNELQNVRRNVGEATADFNRIEEGDRIMVCLRGKDSYTTLRFCAICSKVLINFFSLVAVNPIAQPGFLNTARVS